MSLTALRIAIIGAGFSAHAAAISLIRHARQPIRIAIIDPREENGGLAYGKADDSHILNTRAAHFSVLAGEPSDFVNWARENIPALAGMDGIEDAYLPRRYVQAYIHTRLDEASRAQPLAEVLRIRDRVTSLAPAPGGYLVRLADGRPIEADVAILASGYGADRRLHFGLDPFGEVSRRRASRAKRIAFIGSGLTFMDGYLRIRALGFSGEAVSFSRSARLPAPHADHHAPPIRLDLAPESSLRTILREARARAGALQEDEDWRSLINGLRAEAQPLWQNLSANEKARFERHLRPIWDRLRHRAPPHLHAAVQRDLANGSLVLERARVTATRHGFNGWSVDLYRASGSKRERAGDFDLVFDCSGPSIQSVHPLAAPLTATGLARPGPNGAGVDVLPSGALIGAGGKITNGLFALGPLGAGALLEITAAPEIVSQAELLAQSCASLLPGTITHPASTTETRNDRHPGRRTPLSTDKTALRAARPGSRS